MRAVLHRSDGFVKKVLSRQAKEKLVRLFPGVRNKVDSLLFLSGIDWSRTAAYSRENHPAISINLKGREPQGNVAPGKEYDKTCRGIGIKFYNPVVRLNRKFELTNSRVKNT